MSWENSVFLELYTVLCNTDCSNHSQCSRIIYQKKSFSDALALVDYSWPTCMMGCICSLCDIFEYKLDSATCVPLSTWSSSCFPWPVVAEPTSRHWPFCSAFSPWFILSCRSLLASEAPEEKAFRKKSSKASLLRRQVKSLLRTDWYQKKIHFLYLNVVPDRYFKSHPPTPARLTCYSFALCSSPSLASQFPAFWPSQPPPLPSPAPFSLLRFHNLLSELCLSYFCSLFFFLKGGKHLFIASEAHLMLTLSNYSARIMGWKLNVRETLIFQKHPVFQTKIFFPWTSTSLSFFFFFLTCETIKISLVPHQLHPFTFSY